jgi:hypothetical protein
VLTDHIEVSNASEGPLTLRVYASDAFNPRAGGFDLLVANRKPVDVGAWVKVSQETVTVPGRGKLIVPFTLTIPANATPGDHVGGVVASMSTVQTNAKGDKVSVDQRVGARIYLRVSGQLTPSLTVDGLTATYHPTLNPFGSGRATLTYTLRNKGNIRLDARQSVTVDTPWGQRITAPVPKDAGEILPGNGVEVTTEVRGLVPAVWLTARVHLDPLPAPGDKDPKLISVDQDADFWAVSWSVLAIVVIVIGGGVIWFLVRRRRRRGSPTQPTRGAGDRVPVA